MRHLKFKRHPLWLVILASWGIAFLEYCLMVPANRWGYGRYSAIELKIIQEVITLSAFSAFVLAYLEERPRWHHLAAFACIFAAVAFTFLPTRDGQNVPPNAHAGAGKNSRTAN